MRAIVWAAPVLLFAAMVARSDDAGFPCEVPAGPGDFATYKRLLDDTPSRPKPGVLAPEFKRKMDEHPGDARWLYLYGRALIGKNTPEAIVQLTRAREAAPGNPWVYTALAAIYASPNFGDREKLFLNIGKFRELCPASLEGFRYLDRVTDAAETAVLARELRGLLEGAGAVNAMYWSKLWAAEFRTTPQAGYAVLRERVADDVKRIEQMPHGEGRAWRLAIGEGYRLSGQKTTIDDGEAQVLKAYREFEQKHGLRTRNDITQEEYKTIFDEQARLAAGWVEEWPSSHFAWNMRLSSMSRLPGWTKEQMEQAGERLLELDKARGIGWTYTPSTLRVAQSWVRHGVRLEKAVALAEDALAEISLGPEEPDDLTARPGFFAKDDYGFNVSVWDAMSSVVWGAVQLRDLEKARRMTGRMQAWLDGHEAKDSFQRHYWLSAGRLAEAEGRDIDAVAYYAKTFAGGGWRDDELATRARALWTAQGGSAETWDLLTARPAAPKPPAKSVPVIAPAEFAPMARALPPMKLQDAAGRIWTLADLNGKRTFVNLWATWCAPCVEELPEIEKLYRVVKARGDAQVVTLNLDQNPGEVEPFLKAHGYTFPALLEARAYVEAFIGPAGIPQNWLVDRRGVVLQKSTGFTAAKDWPARMLDELMRLPE